MSYITKKETDIFFNVSTLSLVQKLVLNNWDIIFMIYISMETSSCKKVGQIIPKIIQE